MQDPMIVSKQSKNTGNTSEMRSEQDVSDAKYETFLKNNQINLVPHNTMHNLSGSR